MRGGVRAPKLSNVFSPGEWKALGERLLRREWVQQNVDAAVGVVVFKAKKDQNHK